MRKASESWGEQRMGEKSTIFFQTSYFAIILDLWKSYKEMIENFHIPFIQTLLIWAFYVTELVPNYFSNKLPQNKWLKPTQINQVRVLEVRSLKMGLKVPAMLLSSLEALGENTFSCLVQHLLSSSIHWFMATFHFQRQQQPVASYIALLWYGLLCLSFPQVRILRLHWVNYVNLGHLP